MFQKKQNISFRSRNLPHGSENETDFGVEKVQCYRKSDNLRLLCVRGYIFHLLFFIVASTIKVVLYKTNDLAITRFCYDSSGRNLYEQTEI